MQTQYFTVFVDAPLLSENLRNSLAYQIHHDELYVSPNLKLSSKLAAAHINDRQTAESYVEACCKVFERRYGSPITLRIDYCSETTSKKLAHRIERDSALIRARLEQQCFSPNRRPQNMTASSYFQVQSLLKEPPAPNEKLMTAAFALPKRS